MNVTIKDIARLASVSYSTVSKALNNSPLVRSDTKQRIVEIAHQLAYQPNFAAQRLVSKRSKTVGIVLPSLEKIALSALVERINHELTDRGYEVIFSILGIRDALNMFQRLQVDGIVVFEGISSERTPREVITTGIPFISIGSSDIWGTRYALVDAKRKDAIGKAVRYLVGLGHRHIAYLGDARVSDSKQQVEVTGFCEVALACGLSPESAYVINAKGDTWLQGYVAGRELMNATHCPTAVITGAFDLTAGFLRSVQDAGRSVPHDVSLISYDHIPKLAELDVPVTAVGAPIDVFAQRIASMLLTIMNSQSPISLTELIDVEIVERSSCLPYHETPSHI
jgi:LacI family transcriptional regulator